MKVVHKKTVLEQIEDHILESRENNREIAYIALSKKEALKLHAEILDYAPHLTGTEERYLKALQDPLDRVEVWGVRLCYFGSEAHRVFEARR